MNVIQPRPPAERRLRELAILCDYDPEKPVEEEMRDVVRYTFALIRWPDDEFDSSFGDDLRAIWDLAGDTAEALPWDFPRTGLVEGNDYPNVLHFIKKKSGLDPSVPLYWDADNVEWQESA